VPRPAPPVSPANADPVGSLPTGSATPPSNARTAPPTASQEAGLVDRRSDRWSVVVVRSELDRGVGDAVRRAEADAVDAPSPPQPDLPHCPAPTQGDPGAGSIAWPRLPDTPQVGGHASPTVHAGPSRWPELPPDDSFAVPPAPDEASLARTARLDTEQLGR
jgi:hypothetical protein